MTFAKINNMFRHLKNVHKSKEPFVCKHCGKRFAKSKILTTHLAKHRADKRRAQESAEEALENSGNGRFTCEFPGTVSHFAHFSFTFSFDYVHSVSYAYAVLPFYDVKCLFSGGRE